MRSIGDLARLDGRVALITGGAGHIGSAIAEAMVEAGADVALVDRDMVRLDERAATLRSGSNQRVATFEIDLTNEAAVRAVPPAVVSSLGRLDILVNCAAFVGTTKLEGWAEPFERQGASAWRQAFEVNVTAAFELTQTALPWLRSGGFGSVINVSSIYGSLGPDWSLYEGTSMANPAAYGASKGALEQLTRWLATTIGPEVRVNGISPGGVARGQPNAFVSRYENRTPLKRMAKEEDFKGPSLFLASDLSAYVTGQILMVDGGWCAW